MKPEHERRRIDRDTKKLLDELVRKTTPSPKRVPAIKIEKIVTSKQLQKI